PRRREDDAADRARPAAADVGARSSPSRKEPMKLLLTSAGVKNKSIEDALVDLLGKPIPEAAALCVTTAAYPMSNGAEMAHRIISGSASTPMTELGWKSVGVLELTALPTIDEDVWVSSVRRTDALLVGGGDPLYLAYWMRGSGLADLF